MPTNVVPLDAVSLPRRAARIRQLMTEFAKNTLSLGAELYATREHHFPPSGPKLSRQGWKTWLRNELDLGENHATALIGAYRKFGHLLGTDKNVPSMRTLLRLVSKNVPETARQEVIERVGKGEKIGETKARKIVKKHLPSPKKANEIARETGKPTAASDGYVYLGADAKDVKESTERRTVVYAVREAIKLLADVKLTAAEFLDYAAPHQLWRAKNEHEIHDALEWLRALHNAWQKRAEK